MSRTLANVNYLIHTDAIKENLIPENISASKRKFVYADEADLLNIALFGKTAKEWREKYPDLKGNVRDYATLIILTSFCHGEKRSGSLKILRGI